MRAELTVVVIVASVASVALPTLGEAVKPTSAATHLVRLESNRFQPAVTRAVAGDTVRFVNGQGGPHNVEFIADSIAEAQRKTIAGAMTGAKIGRLSSPLLILTEEEYRIVVPAMPEGRYAFLCSPHAASMQGALVVGRR